MNSQRFSKKAQSNPPAQPPQKRTSATETQSGGDELFPIVGVGASAGGLEAFTQLLHHLPIDTGMAFVLVQHLDPTQKSLLSEILSRTTQMPVQEVQDGMELAPNQVYVIPPNRNLTIAQGKLRLTPREKSRGTNTTIDVFFRSLAKERRNRAIGVILSGADADGTLGLAAIKAEGGITFAQSESSAQVSNMPQTAIVSGHVDFVLSPEEIAAELANISLHPYLKAQPLSASIEEQTATTKNALTTIFGLLRSAIGVDFTHYKDTTIKRRILRRMALNRLDRLDDYVQFLKDNPSEVQALYQELLINVTSFFRDAGAFEVLKREVFPVILRDRAPELPIRIWVAGCSTGEEAYSIAICLLEFLAHQPIKPPIQIFATDVSETVIEKARMGIYQSSQLADISPDRLQRFFVQVEGGYQISKTVRELCVFARQNLISDPPFSRLDLISCRNVLIYFGASLQKKVLPIFHYGLLPTGFLMLGTSETVGEFSDLFTLIDRKYKIYSKQLSSLRLGMDLVASSHLSDMVLPQPRGNEESRNDVELLKLADQIVLNHYAPVGVVVNGQLEILQFRGQTGTYLEPAPGRASLNLLRMVKEELRLKLRTAIHQARQEAQAVRKEDIRLSLGDRTLSVRLDVVPFKPTTTSEEYFLVLFEDRSLPASVDLEIPGDLAQAESALQPQPQSRRKPSHHPSQQSPDRQEILRLQHELETTRAYLQSIIAEQQATNQDLRAANEEILSSNEELQSTNEELQTAKEEIQATNEELSTINDELHRRNLETTQVSNDFQNLLGSINIPVLMLEGDLRIRRFTPTAASLFNLIPTDVGRPLSDIKHNLNLPDLEEQILEVIHTLNLKTQEVQDQAGHWYDLRIRPYRTIDNRIDGAVVVLVEIDALKRSAEKLREARDYAEAIVQTVRDALIILDQHLHVMTANPRFYELFQVLPNETEGQLIFELGNGQWNIPRLRSLLEDILPENHQLDNFRVDHQFETIGQKAMLLNARRMLQPDGEQMILLSIEDITGRTQNIG